MDHFHVITVIQLRIMKHLFEEHLLDPVDIWVILKWILMENISKQDGKVVYRYFSKKAILIFSKNRNLKKRRWKLVLPENQTRKFFLKKGEKEKKIVTILKDPFFIKQGRVTSFWSRLIDDALWCLVRENVVISQRPSRMHRS